MKIDITNCLKHPEETLRLIKPECNTCKQYYYCKQCGYKEGEHE